MFDILSEIFNDENGELNDFAAACLAIPFVGFVFGFPWVFAHFLKWAYGM